MLILTRTGSRLQERSKRPSLRRMPLRALVFLLGALLLPHAGSRATTVIPPTFDELVERAAVVARTRVLDTRCEWRGEGDDRHIVTIVSLAIDEPIVGNARGTIELEFFGGEIDGERQFISGQTTFAPGDEDILFVSGQNNAITPLVRMMYGRYLVAATDDGRRFVARNNGMPLASMAEVSSPMDGHGAAKSFAKLQDGALISPEAFAAAVRERASQAGRRDLPVK